jgi:hypothetical protein
MKRFPEKSGKIFDCQKNSGKILFWFDSPGGFAPAAWAAPNYDGSALPVRKTG